MSLRLKRILTLCFEREIFVASAYNCAGKICKFACFAGKTLATIDRVISIFLFKKVFPSEAHFLRRDFFDLT